MKPKPRETEECGILLGARRSLQEGQDWNPGHSCASRADAAGLNEARFGGEPESCPLGPPRTSSPHSQTAPVLSLADPGLLSTASASRECRPGPAHPVTLSFSDLGGLSPPAKPAVPPPVYTHSHIPVDSGRENPSFCKRYFLK